MKQYEEKLNLSEREIKRLREENEQLRRDIDEIQRIRQKAENQLHNDF